MRQISLVGAVDEEVGDFFPEFLGLLEESPFLKVSPPRVRGGGSQPGVRWCRYRGTQYGAADTGSIRAHTQKGKIDGSHLEESYYYITII